MRRAPSTKVSHMNSFLQSSRALLVAATVALGSCSSPTRGYDGPKLPADQVATICGVKDHGLAGVLAQGAGSPLNTDRGTDAPDTISIVSVGERTIGEPFVDVLPGRQTIVVRGRKFLINPDHHVSSSGRLDFDAVAGETYNVYAVGSEHQPPWSYVVRKPQSSEVIASSEPDPTALDLPGLPAFAETWTLLDYQEHSNAASSTYCPKGQTLDDWTQIYEQFRKPLSDKLTAKAARDRSVRTRKLNGLRVEVVEVSPTAWVERWVSVDKTEEGGQQRGLNLHVLKEGRVTVSTYATRRRDGVEAELLSWEQQMIDAAGLNSP